MTRFLYITYYWPPSAGAGVQRGVKFVKYLRRMGLEPIVITVDPESASYPGRDDSLVKEIPGDVRVVRTRSFEPLRLLARLAGNKAVPQAGFASGAQAGWGARAMRWVRGNWLIPDARRGWVTYALKAAGKIIEEEDVRCVVISSPPHSSQLIGPALKRRFPKLRWISDLRDPWTDIYFARELHQGERAERINAAHEAAVMNGADALVVVGPSMERALAERYGPTVARKITVIPNGYDAEDMQLVRDVCPPGDRFRVTYVGSMAGSYRPECFFRSMRRVAAMLDRTLELRFVGPVGLEVRELARQIGVEQWCTWLDPVPHDEALKEMAAAHVLLLVIPEAPGDERILTGKLFEYVGVGVPVLGVGPPQGDAAVVLRECGAGRMFARDEEQAMVEWVHAVYQGRNVMHRDERAQAAYERSVQAARLADVIRGE